jgi:hypothetical protein
MRQATLLVCVFCVGVGTSHAATYVVRPDGTGDYATIQEALDASVDGDVVELTDGTFTGDGNRDLVFGGEAITLRSQSGNPEACIIDCEGTETEPHWGIEFVNGEDSDSRLEGVTITNAQVVDPDTGAGGRCRSWSSPTIVNCRFMNCRAGAGANFWCQHSSPTFIDCVFASGTAAYEGAGLFCTSSSPSLEGCMFLDNDAPYAAGLACNGPAAPTLTNCVFSGNTGDYAPAIRCEDTAAPSLTNCTFTGNSSLSGASVIRCQEDASIQLFNSIIAFNTEAMPVACDDNGTVALSCSDIYGNDGGDWVGYIADQAGIAGNMSGDPQFCSTAPDADRNWALQSDSPCAAGNSACGGVGAQTVGCAAAALRAANWGAIKATFRDASR